MNGKYVCSICGKDYNDLTNYMNCVSACYEKKLKEEKEAENAKRLAEVNAFISKVKAAEKYLTEVKDEFKTKYPKEYELNFCMCKCDTGDEAVKPVKTKSIELSYESDGKSPKMSAKVNGKEVKDDFLKPLLENPETEYIAKLLKLDSLIK